MDRNAESFFETMPTIDIPRSKWTRPYNHKTTFNNGELIPFFVDLDVLPGMTIKNRTSVLIRMNTPKYQTMDNMFLDTFYFKVPWWTIWENAKQFFGENELGAWTTNFVERVIPKFKTDTNNVNGIHDTNTYMGIPYNTQCEPWSKLGVRSIIRCWNYYFRSEPLQAPLTMYTGDGDTVIDGTEVTGGTTLKVCKFSDYFTRALPEPEKSPYGPIKTPLGTTAPVIGNGKTLGFTDGTNNFGVESISGSSFTPRQDLYGTNVGTSSALTPGQALDKSFGITTDTTKSGLIADLSQAVAATIDAQRLAWATERIYQRDGIFGTRYFQESLRAHWGVTTDAGKDIIPEFLGGKRIPLNIQETIQTSETTATSPLGFTGGYSVTNDINEDFIKSFDQHCVILGLCCVRCKHSYQQGVARMWTRSRRLDTYYPEMSHIGNQKIYNYEIFSDGSANDKGTFGFKEAWAEYKYKNDMISGELLSTYAQSLDAWHTGDYYLNLPVLSSQWITEPTEFLDRTLLIKSTTHNQFTADFYIEQEIAAPMPLHCVPGLVDHF